MLSPTKLYIDKSYWLYIYYTYIHILHTQRRAEEALNDYDKKHTSKLNTQNRLASTTSTKNPTGTTGSVPSSAAGVAGMGRKGSSRQLLEVDEVAMRREEEEFGRVS